MLAQERNNERRNNERRNSERRNSERRSSEQAALRQARQEVLTELTHLRQEMQCEVDSEVDDADAQITEHQTDAILITLLEQRVQDIDHALAAIEQGHYGICEQCGQEIEPERLRAKADARLCIDCQEALEMQAWNASVIEKDDDPS